MAKQKIETSIEINGIDVVAYPLVESDHVTFENGMSFNEMIKGDVVTPVVTHEETSFKVGKGDSDVSSSIVDGSVGEMIIKGQTYQNILPEPSLRNSMSNGKTMQKFNEGYDNVNVVDGVGKSVILKGQTLTNIHKLVRPILEAETPSNYAITKNSVGEISFDVLVSEHKKWRYINAGFLNISLLKPNTKYLVVFEESQNITWVKFMSGNALNAISESGKVQNNRAIVTTLNQITDNRQILYLTFEDGTPNTKVSSKNPMIIEYQDGMENWNIPYFEGMKSVQSPSLASVGKNLIGLVEEWEKADVDNKTGVVISKPNGTRLTSNLILNPIKNRLYVRSIGKIWNYIYYYDINKNYLGYETNQGMTDNFQLLNSYTPTGKEYYVRVSFRDEVAKNEAELYTSDIGHASYEPHKSNILTTPSDLTLRGIGDVCDTLDLVSGEKVERIGEVVFDGRENWRTGGWANQTDTIGFETQIGNARISRIFKGMSDKLSYTDNFNLDKECFTVVATVHGEILVGIRILRSKLSSEDVSGLEKYLQSNPIPIQYELETPIVKTVDLSSSGNWEKVVLDGSEDWFNGDSSWKNRLFGTLKSDIYINFNSVGSPNVFSDSLRSSVMNELCNGSTLKTGISNFNDSIFVSMEGINSIAELQSYLRANPITVWYQTATHKDSTQVKQPLSFSNGHVQLSSKEGSLIPSLDYEVPTSNSYHLDLAKTSTQYTMKNMSGTFTIDNNNYNASANSAFTTPTSMANKLMITSVVQSNVMLLEGDLTSKTIPYFKGIKSAFEGEGEIEVLSVGKNLFDNSRVNNYLAEYLDNGYVKITGGKEGDIFAEQRAKPLIKPNTKYTITVDIIENTMAGVFEVQYSGDKRASLKSSFYIDTGFVGKISKTCNSKEVIENELVLVPKVIKQNTSGHVIFRIIVEETSTPTSYEPYKSNITKIPLSSPLRSLPNGVRDEVILDRENNKVKVIQRVGYEVLTQDGQWGAWEVVGDTMKIGRSILPHAKTWGEGVATPIPYTRDSITQPNEGVFVYRHASNSEVRVRIKQKRTGRHDIIGVCNWLKDNNVTILYELETPIITEIALEGYPYIYKDGHIFLNSKIAPTTTMKYSINQSHQIASQNGDLIRHEKEINYLYTLIAKYVNVQYESTLLNLDLELSRA